MSDTLKKSLPHIVAVLLFLGLSVIYFAPEVFDNKGLMQGDVTSAQGWGKDLADHYKETGEHAFWSNRMFGGMPHNYAYSAPIFNIFSSVSRVFSLYFLSGNAFVVFLSLIGFYIFMIALGCRHWLSIIGAIAYAFASLNYRPKDFRRYG